MILQMAVILFSLVTMFLFYIILKYKSELAENKERLRHFEDENKILSSKNEKAGETLAQNLKELTILKTNTQNFDAQKKEWENRLKEKEKEYFSLKSDETKLKEELAVLKEKDQFRASKHDESVTQLMETIKSFKEREEKELQLKREAEIQKIEDLKKTWARHQDDVKRTLTSLCREYEIEYVTEFPHAGEPDNLVRICGQLVVFDAKSSESERNLNNIQSYIKSEAGKLEKYTAHDDVSNEAFLVIPSFAATSITQKDIRLGDKLIHVITPDALGSILFLLKKLESYAAADVLGIDDKSKIASYIGRMAHGMKRQVQINNYMSKEYISILSSEHSLPEEIFVEAKKVETTSKIALPPQSKKEIPLKTLEKETSQIYGVIQGQGINVDITTNPLESLPLYAQDDVGLSKTKPKTQK